MKRKFGFVISMLCSLPALAQECDTRDAGIGQSEQCSELLNTTAYAKNLPECPQPQSLCATASTPLNASLSCRAVGAGSLLCNAYPTSPSGGVLSYNWSVTKMNGVTVFNGYGASSIEALCSENSTYNVQVTVSDIFGKSETIYVSELCLVGSEN